MKQSIMLGLCALVICALVGGDLVGLAQNANSSAPMPQNDNANMGTTRRGRGRRGTRRTSSMNDNMAGNSNEMTTGEPSMQNTNDNTGAATMPTTGRRGRRGRRNMPPPPPADTTGTPADTSGAMQTGGAMPAGTLGRVGDPASLDGTYTGTINYPGGNMTGDATLTINGNTFTLESGGQTATGTLTSQQWPGQIAVSMRFGTETPAKIISLRAKKTGNGIWLMNTSGESQVFSFHSGGGGRMGGGRRRGRRRAMPATPAEPATPPAETPAEGTGAMPATPAMPAGGRRRRSGRRRGGNTNMNTNTGDNTNNSNTR